MELRILNAKQEGYSAQVKYFDVETRRDKTIYLCSKINPLLEGERWAKNVYDSQKEVFVIYGLGIGYHIIALAKLLQEHQYIYVIESNVAVHKEVHDIISQELWENDKINLVITNDLNEITQTIIKLKDTNSKFEAYEPALKIMPEEMIKLKDVIRDQLIRKQGANKFGEMIRYNYIHNNQIEAKNVTELFNTCKGKPIVIVSGGPSLDKNIDYLKNADADIIIFATGRAFKYLLEKGIKVDYFCVIDPQEITYNQIQGVEESDVPFIFLNTACHYTVSKYKGPKYIAYSMDSPPEQLGRIESGGSVATAVLELSILFGGEPIIFIGQDLAYTNSQSHAQGVVSEQTSQLVNMKMVRGIDGEYLYTTSGLLSFKHWIEDKIKQHPEKKFYNCTEGGAYIEGCEHRRLINVLEELKEKEK